MYSYVEPASAKVKYMAGLSMLGKPSWDALYARPVTGDMIHYNDLVNNLDSFTKRIRDHLGPTDGCAREVGCEDEPELKIYEGRVHWWCKSYARKCSTNKPQVACKKSVDVKPGPWYGGRGRGLSYPEATVPFLHTAVQKYITDGDWTYAEQEADDRCDLDDRYTPSTLEALYDAQDIDSAEVDALKEKLKAADEKKKEKKAANKRKELEEKGFFSIQKFQKMMEEKKKAKCAL
ncbi:unnamed protein product [Vitrella brassicaformis CCMP3155]|uniref:Uncharacterized protein n=1 Tax=Vitrella brassicaformis (strain CCMP3155) TaxID=1169540 RepID=A0A0G4EFR2_VITBC|nr:unnamed protein product [Vitrella brassicaformis CCMP3155]|eukprot:CEL94249.1 unnamed protein product [Vitrella brassicaformis CCMP3155]